MYGRGAGLLNFHIRSGTNRLHGGGWEYLRNNVLDAKGFFATEAPTEKQNEFGFKLGGPVYIPKIYDGKDKTFFFTNFNWFRFRGGNSNSLTTLPTAAMKTGDFSSLVNPAINLGINPCDGSTVFVMAERFSGLEAFSRRGPKNMASINLVNPRLEYSMRRLLPGPHLLV